MRKNNTIKNNKCNDFLSLITFQVEDLRKNCNELEVARARLGQESGDLGKQVEEFESKVAQLTKAKKSLEQQMEELKRQNEEETRVNIIIIIHPFSKWRIRPSALCLQVILSSAVDAGCCCSCS